MKWSGETEEQRMVREDEWHKWFARFPVQMPEGTGAPLWVYREIGSDWEPKEPQHLTQMRI